MLALESITQILNNEYQIQMNQQFMLRALEVSRNALPACQPNRLSDVCWSKTVKSYQKGTHKRLVVIMQKWKP